MPMRWKSDSDEVTATAAFDAVTPDVSVVIPCYNYARFVTEAIDSVAASHGLVPEIIVVDDHSDDGASELVRRIKRQMGGR